MRSRRLSSFLPFLLLGALPAGVVASSVLQTSGFSACLNNASVVVNKMNIQYDSNTRNIDFDVSGTSTKSQNVTAKLSVSAFGKEVYTNSFNPCDHGTFVAQLCPGKL